MLAATTNVATVPEASATMEPTTAPSGMHNSYLIKKYVKRNNKMHHINLWQ